MDGNIYKRLRLWYNVTIKGGIKLKVLITCEEKGKNLDKKKEKYYNGKKESRNKKFSFK